MRTFSCCFIGHYPVGACAIVVAPDETEAELILRKELRMQGLDNLNPDLRFVEIDTTEQQALILLNGDY